MERSTIHWMAKRGKSIRQIAKEVGHNRRTVARVLGTPKYLFIPSASRNVGNINEPLVQVG